MPTAATAAKARATTNNENANPSTATDVNNNNGDAPTAATTTMPPAGTGTPPPAPGGSARTPHVLPSPVACANDGRAWFSGATVKMRKTNCQWTDNECSEGCGNGTIKNHSELDCFMACFPKMQLLWMVDRLNDVLVQNKSPPATVGELLKWFGALLLVTRFEFGNRAQLWSDKPSCKCQNSSPKLWQNRHDSSVF